jgi:hypothetical protein
MIQSRQARPKIAALMVAIFLLAGCAAHGPMGPGGNSESAVASLPSSAGPSTVPTPDRLTGLTGDDLRAAFGVPALLRQEGPTQLWQYAGTGCVLHVFLSEENGVYRVKHAETRIDDPAASPPPTCVAWKGTAPAS